MNKVIICPNCNYAFDDEQPERKNDQPNYDHNEAFLLAKENGLKTEFPEATSDSPAIEEAFKAGWEMGHDSGSARDTMYGTTIEEDWKAYKRRSNDGIC